MKTEKEIRERMANLIEIHKDKDYDLKGEKLANLCQL